MSLPAPVQQVLQKEADSIEFFKLAANDRIECTLNGHSIPADHIEICSGKKFKKLVAANRQVSQLKKFEPFLVPSKRMEGHLFCSLTSQLVKANMPAAKKHISGTRFLLAKERFMDDRADLAEEPTADAQTAKPIRRAHCKSGAELDEHEDPECLEPDSEASGSSEASQGSSERDNVLDIENIARDSSASDDEADDASIQHFDESEIRGQKEGSANRGGCVLAATGVKDATCIAKLAGGVGRCRVNGKQEKRSRLGVSKGSQDEPEGAQVMNEAELLREGQNGAKVQDTGQSGARGTGHSSRQHNVPSNGRKQDKQGKESKGSSVGTKSKARKGKGGGVSASDVVPGQEVSESGQRVQKRVREESQGHECDTKASKAVKKVHRCDGGAFIEGNVAAVRTNKVKHARKRDGANQKHSGHATR